MQLFSAAAGDGSESSSAGAAKSSYATKAAPRGGIGYEYLKKPEAQAIAPSTASRGYMDQFNATNRSQSLLDIATSSSAKPIAGVTPSAPTAAAAAAATSSSTASSRAPSGVVLGGVARSAGPDRSAAAAAASAAARRPFDRDKDLAIPRKAMEGGVKTALDKIGNLGGRFGSGAFERSF